MRRRLALLVLSLSPFFAFGAAAALPPGAVVPLSYVSPADAATRNYALRIPATWDGASLLPAVLLLHGRGGTRLQFQRPEHFAGADGVPDETDVLACLDDALARAPIDPDRVALAGFSQGGRGALGVGLLNPTRFAALVDAAGPTDAFQGQIWSPGFPDYLSAAGGPASLGGEVLARWFELSPRFLLPNARNLFVAVLHGQADGVGPDSTSFFPYRNGHHVSVTPGFADARGPAPTLAELEAADPGGYAFTTWFPADVGHEQLRLLPPGVLFDAVLGKVRVSRPGRVVGVSFGTKERTFHWARLARTAAPDGTRVFLDARADAATNSFDLVFEGPARVRLDLPGSGLDAAAPLAIQLSGETRLDLALAVPAHSSRAFTTDELLSLPPAGPVASPLRLRVVSGDAGAVVASARVFNATATGTYGLSFPVLPAGGSVLGSGETALLFAPPDSRRERTNVSLFAPFEASAAEVTLLDGSGSIPHSQRLDLAPLHRVQLDDLLAGTAMEPVSIRVTVLAGRVQTYGTAISNSGTNDPWRIPALPLDDVAPGWTVPAVASAPGRSGAYFRSDLFLFSPGDATLDASLLPRDGSQVESVRLVLRAGETRFVPDVLATLFPSKAPGAGALVLSSSGGLLPLAVTRSEPETGPSSQDLACVPRGAEAAPGRPVAFAGVDESPAARSNLVLVAPAAASRVRLALYAADGLRGELVVEVAAGRVVQLDSVAALFPGGAVEGATLVVRAEGGPVVASVARIDNGSNDPAGLAPLPLAAP